MAQYLAAGDLAQAVQRGASLLNAASLAAVWFQAFNWLLYLLIAITLCRALIIGLFLGASRPRSSHYRAVAEGDDRPR